jgi:hypothetical protein
MDSPFEGGSCERLKSSSIAAPLAPTRERGWGVRGIAVLPQRALVFPHLERFFSLSWDSMRHASPPSPLTPLPLGRGEPRSFNFFAPSGCAGVGLLLAHGQTHP